MEMPDVLSKAFQIGTSAKFRVRFFEDNGKSLDFIKEQYLTYIELGMYLINNQNAISLVEITIKKE